MRYILLLRGINVGGKNKVSMNDLKELLLKAGLKMLILISTAEICFSVVSKTVRVVSPR